MAGKRKRESSSPENSRFKLEFSRKMASAVEGRGRGGGGGRGGEDVDEASIDSEHVCFNDAFHRPRDNMRRRLVPRHRHRVGKDIFGLSRPNYPTSRRTHRKCPPSASQLSLSISCSPSPVQDRIHHIWSRVLPPFAPTLSTFLSAICSDEQGDEGRARKVLHRTYWHRFQLRRHGCSRRNRRRTRGICPRLTINLPSRLTLVDV